jgi:ADP-ribose pyrophosphatase
VEPLPRLPRITLRVAKDRTSEARATGGFLNLRRLDLVATAPDGKESPPFHYDLAMRASLDAVVMAAHYTDQGVRYVFLRSAMRPALALRPIPLAGTQATWHDGGLWELPAGLIDGDEAPAEAAARELAEELGFVLDPRAMNPLGPPVFPAPGFIAEEHHFFHVEVDPGVRQTPSEDGSALEKDAVIVAVPLADALEYCRAGDIRDSKTELLLRRLAERFG